MADSGVLVVGVGRATRLLTYVVGTAKSYQATIRLGVSTVTDDAEGEITGGASADHLSDEQVRDAGWAGMLTLPRELYLHGGALGSRPAAELIELRGVSLDWHPGLLLRPGAYEVVVMGPARLLLDGRHVGQAEGRPTTPARIFIDGSIVEVFVDGNAFTTRAYPGADSTWAIDAEAGHVAVFPLRLPRRAPQR